MTTTLDGLPSLDAHAHIDPTVTVRQVEALGHSHTFAVTRSLDEARQVVHSRGADRLTWGIGVHPGVASAQERYDEAMFARLLPSFSLVGEIGLDRRAGDLSRQALTLESVLRVAADQPVLLSVHSTGATELLLDLLEAQPHPGLILHWWADDGPTLSRAVATGAYFSVNAAVKPTILSRLPLDRVLTETDFPARRGGGRRPGDTGAVEAMLGEAWGAGPQETRHRVWANLRRLSARAQALDRLPEPLADLLEGV
jgi:TatD DNase family protein